MRSTDVTSSVKERVYDLFNKNAKKFEAVSFQEAVENRDINVMDKAALGLAMEQNMPVIIFRLEDDSILKAATGKSIGTKVS